MPEPIALIQRNTKASCSHPDRRPVELLEELEGGRFVFWLERCESCSKKILCRGATAPAILVTAR